MDRAALARLPGAGIVFGSWLLAAFGTDRDRFAGARGAQCYFGLAPATKQSGRTRVVHRRRSIPRFEHQTFMEWVGISIIESIWARGC